MKRSFFSLLIVAAAPVVAACSGDDTSATQTDAASPDATTLLDSGSDTSTAADTSPTDSSSNDSAPNDSGGGDAGPDALSFNDDVYTAIIAKHCTFCHGPGADGGPGSGIQFGHLDMGTAANAYANLLGDGGGAPASGGPCATLGASGLNRVVPGNPTNSLFYNKVASNDGDGGTLALADGGPMVFCGHAMPLNGHALAAADLATIHDWIAQGGGQ